MPSTLSPAVSESSLANSINNLCKKGFYIDALKLAEKQWGPINTWNSDDQVTSAIRLYANLGGDRKSDAILLSSWRKRKSNPDLLHRMLFYKLNKLGPILANEFLKQHESDMLENKKLESDLIGFKSIIQRIFKNYSVAEQLIKQGSELDPENNWLVSLKIQLLSEQEELDSAKQQAKAHFESYPSTYNLRVLSGIVAKVDGVAASIALYREHVDKFQSANVWLEYAQLLAGDHNWPDCEFAIEQFEKTRITHDKYDDKNLLAYKGQIAIHHQQIPQAIDLLSKIDSVYWNFVIQNLKDSNGKLTRKVLDVPFLRQEHMTCAPTTLAALSRYWGFDHDSKTIADQICFDGTHDIKERQWLRDNNFYFKEFELEAELAYSLIDKNIPFALVTTDGFSSHIQAVIGYNRQVGTLYIMDPSQTIMQEMLTKETISCEAYNGARCLVFVPSEKADLLTQFEFAAAEMYRIRDVFSVAQHRNDFLSAQTALAELKKLDPEHRITLRTERDFSIWNNDTNNIFKLNTMLLKTFPNETVLLNSQYFCLRDLGKREQGLTLLSDYLDKNNNLDLLGTLFNQIYDTNAHKQLSEQLLQKMKLSGGYSAHCHWLIANYYWQVQSFQKAAEHYLYAHCLDETNSQYIESYFSSSRYLKQQHEAISLLKDRFDKFKVRSAMPAISLFKAHELMDEEHIGIDYLFAAFETHPDDKDLIIYLSNKLIDNGLTSRFEDIQPQIKSQLDAKDFNELLARKSEKLGDFDSALGFYQQTFNENPFIPNYANGYFGLLSKRGDTVQIDKILEELYQANPDNTQILDYIADWHSVPTFQEEVLTKFVTLRPDYGVIRRQLIDVRLKLGMFEQALAEAKETCQNIIGEHINQSYLAKCCLKLGQFEEARKITKQVLSNSVDNNLAFSTLMEASITKEEKQASLEFVFTQIQSQVIFGEGAWNFWFDAKSILSHERLQEFCNYMLEKQAHLWFTYSLCADYYKQYGELEKAKELLQQGKQKFPLTPRIYSDLGGIHELEGNILETIAEYSQALVINPAWSEVTMKLCDVMEKHEDIKSAITIVEKGIKHDPNNGILFGYLADLLIKQNRKDEALQALQSAVSNNIDYRWAWNQFIDVSNQQQQSELPHTIALKLSEQKPYLPHVWRDLAFVTKDHSEKLALFDKSLKCDLYFIPTYQDKTHYFVGKGQYKEALNVLDNTPWGDDLPIELTIQKVDLLVEIGQKTVAIDTLKHILFNVHGYSHLWRQLFDLLEQAGNQQDYIECCHKSVELNRHEPFVLCYAGENLLRLGNEADKPRASEYLKKAFDLSPNEQHIVLTYVDNLVENEQYQESLNALKLSENIANVGYAKTREIGVLCKLARETEAFEVYQQMLKDNETDYWCLNQSYIYLSEHYNSDQLADLFKSRINELNREQSYFFTDKCLYLKDSKKYKHVLKELEHYTNEESWNGAFLALLEFWNEKDILPPKDVIDGVFDRIIEVPALVAQLGNGYISAEHYNSLILLVEKAKTPEELPAYVFYHYSLALKMLNNWDKSGNAVLQGMQQPPDMTVHNLRLWNAYELIRTGANLTILDLEVIDYEELVELERYVYSTLRVHLELGDSSLESKVDALDRLLRKCTQDYQHVVGHKMTLHAKQTLKTKLKSAVESEGIFAKMKISFWIYNRT